jgi:hypothetical protein
MWHRVKDLSSEQRAAIENLIGRSLREDEGLNIQPSRVLKEAPSGEERSYAYSRYLGHLDQLARRANDIPDEELDAVIDEACDQVRHPSS